MPPRNDPNPYNNSSLSAGGWLGIGKLSVSGAKAMGVGIAKGLYETARNPVGTAVNMGKSILDTASRVDDYAVLIQNSHGNYNTPRRQKARQEIAGKGLQDLGNLGAVVGGAKFLNSPAGRSNLTALRHDIGQLDIAGQPLRTQILKSEIKQTAKKITGSSSEIVSGPTQARNMYGLRSSEARAYYDPVEEFSQTAVFRDSPNLIRAKLGESQAPWYGDNKHNQLTLYEHIQQKGLNDLPPTYVRLQDGRTLLSDGHHRIAAANDINNKLPTKWVVNERSFNTAPDPVLKAAEKLDRFIVNRNARKASKASVNINRFLPQTHQFTPNTKAWLADQSSPTVGQFTPNFANEPPNVWSQPQNKPLPKKSSSKKK